jgi:hypothetical protein
LWRDDIRRVRRGQEKRGGSFLSRRVGSNLFSEKPKHLSRGEVGEAQGEIGHAGVPVLENPVTTMSRIPNERGLEKWVAIRQAATFEE